MSAAQPAFGELFVRSVDDAKRLLTITSASFPLVITQGSASGDAVTIPADHDVVLRADRVVVRGAIRCPGRSISIYARVVQGEGDASIDTGGVQGDPPPTAKPMSTYQPKTGARGGYGQDGGEGEKGVAAENGNTGAAGKPAGPITLFADELRGNRLTLRAVGGKGGKGQDAQTPVAGGRGGEGGSPNGNPDHNPAGDGGRGGRGGNGGIGGQGGPGGAGAKITVRVRLAIGRLSDKLTADTNGGQGGDGGAGTAGAKGGPGGPRCEGHKDRRETRDGAQGDPGDPGHDGQRGTSPAPVPMELRDGVPAAEFDAGMTAPHMQMILRLATLRLLLRDQDRNEIAKMLGYVMALAGAKTGDPQITSAYKRANALLFQTARGIDVQGHPENFAPRLDVETYRKNLETFVRSFKDVRDDYTKYFGAASTREEKLAELEKMRAKAQALIDELNKQLNEGLELAKGMIRMIDTAQARCGVQLLKWREKLARFEQDLKAVATSSGCVFGTLDLLLKGLDVLTKTGNATIKKFAGNAHDAQKMIDEVIPDAYKPQTIDKTIAKLDSLGENLAELADAYRQNQSMVIDQKDPNAYKLLLSQEQLNKALEPFMQKFSAAADLKAAMDDYVVLVQARNDLILKFNEQVAALAGAKARSGEAAQQRAQAEQLLAQKADPNLVEFATFSGNVFHATKELCVEQLYLTWKAAVFYSLDRNFDVFARIRDLGAKTDLDWAAFESGANDVVRHLQTAEEKFSSDVIVFPRDENGQGVIFVIKDAASLAALRADKSLIVRVPPALLTSGFETPFNAMCDVRIKRARVWISGVKTKNEQLAVYLTQTGHETIVDPKNQQLDFIHSEVKTRLVYNYTTRHIISGGDIRLSDSKYAAVGPFAEWRITIFPEENEGLDLGGMSEIQLEFHVTHRLFKDKGLRAEQDAAPRIGTLVAEYVG